MKQTTRRTDRDLRGLGPTDHELETRTRELGPYRSRVGNMGGGPRSYRSLAWKPVQVNGAAKITSWKIGPGT